MPAIVRQSHQTFLQCSNQCVECLGDNRIAALERSAPYGGTCTACDTNKAARSRQHRLCKASNNTCKPARPTTIVQTSQASTSAIQGLAAMHEARSLMCSVRAATHTSATAPIILAANYPSQCGFVPACISDAQCARAAMCQAEVFPTLSNTGYFCFQSKAAQCKVHRRIVRLSVRTLKQLIDLTSIDGTTSHIVHTSRKHLRSHERVYVPKSLVRKWPGRRSMWAISAGCARMRRVRATHLVQVTCLTTMTCGSGSNCLQFSSRQQLRFRDPEVLPIARRWG